MSDDLMEIGHRIQGRISDIGSGLQLSSSNPFIFCLEREEPSDVSSGSQVFCVMCICISLGLSSIVYVISGYQVKYYSITLNKTSYMCSWNLVPTVPPEILWSCAYG